jgi:lysine-specific demethylase 8
MLARSAEEALEQLFDGSSSDGEDHGTVDGVHVAGLVDGRIPPAIVYELDNYVKKKGWSLAKRLLQCDEQEDKDTGLLVQQTLAAFEGKHFKLVANNASNMTRKTFLLLKKYGSWPSMSCRDVYVLGQLLQAVAALVDEYGTQGGSKEDESLRTAVRCIRHADRAFILGGSNRLVSLLHALVGPKAKIQWKEMQRSYPLERQGVFPTTLQDGPSIPLLDPQRTVQVLPCPTVEEFEAKCFRKDGKVPHVLSNVVSPEHGWEPAIKNWNNLKYFRSEHGHRLVPIEVGRFPTFVGNKGDKEAESAELHCWKESLISIDEFCEAYMLPSLCRHVDSERDTNHTKRRLQNVYDTLPHVQDVGYLAQHNLFDQIREMKQEFKVPPYCNSFGRSLIKSNAWFGTDGTCTPLHFDSYDNFLTQVAGFKYVRLYDSSQTKYLYQNTGASEEGSKASAGAQGNLSPVRVEYPDVQKHPKFTSALFTECILAPGDMLFIPQGTWHYVRSLSPSFSVNFWF